MVCGWQIRILLRITVARILWDFEGHLKWAFLCECMSFSSHHVDIRTIPIRIALIAVISGSISKRAERVNSALYCLACLQAVTGGLIAENPFRSVIERHFGFLRRALPGTSGRAQKSRERGRGGGGER